MFGTLELERRRPDVVCAALERVARAHPDRAFELVLIGPIPESTARFLDDTRRRALPFALRATGKLPIDAVAGVLSECDAAFSFDTHQLGGVSTCSTSCAAILATGVPLVGNQGPDTDGIFEDGANVIFCAIDAGEAAAVLERLLDQPALRRKLSAGGRELFQRELRWGRIAEKFETLIEETLPLRGKARSGLSRQPVGH
jgi:glycosyltransferase involved in cell wall biosynthesis